MQVPNFHKAEIPTKKVTDYLLSSTHPDGKYKAKFFEAFGFSLDHWERLENAIREHGSRHEVAKVEASPFGIRYVVEGIMEAPDGRSPRVRTVWFIRDHEEFPFLVTAYPLARREHD